MELQRHLRRDVWHTYAIRAFMHDVANDQSSAGGVHLLQVRHKFGGWQERVLQSNGRHQTSGPIQNISDEVGEDAWQKVLARG